MATEKGKEGRKMPSGGLDRERREERRWFIRMEREEGEREDEARVSATKGRL